MQAKGHWGARHFDKLIWDLPIQEFDRGNATHAALAEAGIVAEIGALVAALPG
jgi:hypothetical protein